ncbi:MAG TPA: ABC transporter ATP-binding protein [Vicinamibacteria bacterium]|nr:ABC transporter ATP-binding protein [Vicinamibacteria bacterium]
MIEAAGVSKVFRLPRHRRHALRALPGGARGFDHVAALQDVSFHVATGEFVGVVGRNGSGKSTLLRLLAGIYPPTAGRLVLGGAVAPILDLGAGFHGMLPVADNVLLYGVLLGLPRAELRAELAEILARAGLLDYAEAPLERVSSGMRLRLAFTVALRSAAPLLLIDEALAVGDAAFREQCVADLRALRARGRTAVLVSHEPDLLGALCDRLLVLDGGRLAGAGPVPAMLELYGALPSR